MRFFEIFLLKEEKDNAKTRKFVEKIQKELKFEKKKNAKLFYLFLQKMKKNVSLELIKFFFENRLYRAESPSKSWSIFFGEKECPKNRPPVDNIPEFQTLIDEHLKSKGFTALRSNSIFVTGNLEFTKRFKKGERKIHVIFPSKNFSFTWNPKVRDFYFRLLNVSENLELNYKKMLSNEKENVLEFFEKALIKITGFHFREVFEVLKEIFEISGGRLLFQFRKEIENIENKKNFSEYFDKIKDDDEKMIFHEILNYSKASTLNEKISVLVRLLNFIQRKNHLAYNHFLEEIIFENNENIRKNLLKYLKIKKNSMFDHFSDSNLENAIANGNEIMIHCDTYYYIEADFFFRNHEIIEKLLNEIPS